MGNVVSSLVMYALQAAWFCQRLIDQDYRENHGSRSKPIMGIHETDLDVFLSKCRTYYLSKRNRNRALKDEEEEEKGELNHLNREENYPIIGTDSANSEWSKGADSLHFDNENFLSRTDQQVSLSEPDFSSVIIEENDLEYFLSKSTDLPRGHRKSDSPKTERRKRKKIYYRKRYNPRGGERPNDAYLAAPSVANCVSLLTADAEDTDSRCSDHSSGLKTGRCVSRQLTRDRPKVGRFSLENGNIWDVEEPPLADHCYSLPKRPKSGSFLPLPSPTVAHDLLVVLKNADSEYFRTGCGDHVDRVLSGMEHKVVKMMIAQECLTGSPFYHDF